MEDSFDIPVVIFIFLRKDTSVQIMNRIRLVRPRKLYILADAGRNEDEIALAAECRSAVEKVIDWECEVIKNYATTNRGVHAQIGMGARWVFEREEMAIFLEDDNLPEASFFYYCKEALIKYRKNKEIFWVCGTNYLVSCQPKNNASVFASRHLMPCGWASWAEKFLEYYDYDLQGTDSQGWEKRLKKDYKDLRLYRQQLRSIKQEVKRKQEGLRYRSWDYHTVFSLRMNNLYGIVPKYNQIKNIGVDNFSTHGGNSMELEMTKRFCGIDTIELEKPLTLPDVADLDFSFESKIGKIILYPFKARMILTLKDILNVPEGVRLRNYLLGRK